MRITILTLFPEMFDSFLSVSIVKRAIEKGLLQVDFVQIRDFAKDKYKHVDDTPFGGGAGMVMKCQPVLDALESVVTPDSYKILMAPTGKPYTQQKAHTLSKKDHLIILCGHYEGLDYRINKHMDEEISIGDYVLSGGEVGAMVLVDSVARLLKGSIAEDSPIEESHENGLLEYPQYTKPADYNGDTVPSVLTNGNHQKIKAWRIASSLKRTKENRPDMYQKHIFTKEELKIITQAKEGKIEDFFWGDEDE